MVLNICEAVAHLDRGSGRECKGVSLQWNEPKDGDSSQHGNAAKDQDGAEKDLEASKRHKVKDLMFIGLVTEILLAVIRSLQNHLLSKSISAISGSIWERAPDNSPAASPSESPGGSSEDRGNDWGASRMPGGSVVVSISRLSPLATRLRKARFSERKCVPGKILRELHDWEPTDSDDVAVVLDDYCCWLAKEGDAPSMETVYKLYDPWMKAIEHIERSFREDRQRRAGMAAKVGGHASKQNWFCYDPDKDTILSEKDIWSDTNTEETKDKGM